MVTCQCLSTVFDSKDEWMIGKDKVDKLVPSDKKFFGISLVYPVFQVNSLSESEG